MEPPVISGCLQKGYENAAAGLWGYELFIEFGMLEWMLALQPIPETAVPLSQSSRDCGASASGSMVELLANVFGGVWYGK